MAVQPNSTAPYAPSATVLMVIERYRRGLPAPINREVLGRAGVPDSLLARTLQALEILDLIDSEGRPSQAFDAIRRAPEAEYQARLRDWLNAAYADVLNFVDPATADETAIRDAFRNYDPVGQQPRMVSLFQGLYTAAGVITAPARQPRPVAQRTTVRRLLNPKAPAPKASPNVIASTARKMASPALATIPPALGGLLESLPDAERGWTQAKRDKFVATFATVLDFCIPIVADDADTPNEEDQDE